LAGFLGVAGDFAARGRLGSLAAVLSAFTAALPFSRFIRLRDGPAKGEGAIHESSKFTLDAVGGKIFLGAALVTGFLGRTERIGMGVMSCST
jgi:hypothetical protein